MPTAQKMAASHLGCLRPYVPTVEINSPGAIAVAPEGPGASLGARELQVQQGWVRTSRTCVVQASVKAGRILGWPGSVDRGRSLE